MYAVGLGDMEIVKLLVPEPQKYVNQNAFWGYVSRCWAIFCLVLGAQVEAGASKDLQNEDGNTALILAALQGQLEIARCFWSLVLPRISKIGVEAQL